MNCDAVREHLAEHLLGALPEQTDAEVRTHLRGCMMCRHELVALDEGMRTFARAAHQVDPPESLKTRVLDVLDEERGVEPEPVRRNGSRLRRIALVAAAAVLLGSAVGMAAVQSNRANQNAGLATSYRNFLHALGGKDVRVGTLDATGQQDVQGSVVMYDSDQGQSWILVLVRAPGMIGPAQAVVSSGQRQMELHPLELDSAGSGSTWLVTANDISTFDMVRIVGPDGVTVATAHIPYH